MPMRRFAVDGLPAMRWKNGGGLTREIACRPAGAGVDGFDWRVSIATIAAGGPFSTFAGIDRVITLLDGGGVRLRSADQAIDHRLDRELVPFAFPGDVEVDAQLLDGSCLDLNVMTRRGRWVARLEVLRADGAVPSAPAGVLLAVRGAWRITTARNEEPVLEQGEGLWWDDCPTGWQVKTGDMRAAIVAVLLRAPAGT